MNALDRAKQQLEAAALDGPIPWEIVSSALKMISATGSESDASAFQTWLKHWEEQSPGRFETAAAREDRIAADYPAEGLW